MTTKTAKTGQKTRKTTTTVIAAPASEADEISINSNDQVQEVESDEIAGLLELGGESEVMWRVTCLSPSAKAGFCTEYSTSDLSLMRIQEEWGGGRYRIQGRDQRRKFVGQRDFTIAERPRNAVQVVQPQQVPSDVQQNMFQMMQQQAQQQIQMLTSLVTGLINKPAQAITPPDPIAMIAALKDIMAPASVKDNAIETLLRGLELGKELAGGGGGDSDSWAGIIGKGLDTFKPLLSDAMKQQQQAAANPRPAQPRPTPSALPSPAPDAVPIQPEETDVNVMQMAKVLPWLQSQVRALLHQAKRNKDPALYAEVFLDNLPDFMPVEMILQKFSEQNAVQDLVAINAEVADHLEWFEDFKAEVLKMITTEPEDGADEFVSGLKPGDSIGGAALGGTDNAT